MKNDCKRLLGLVMALCLLISMVPAVAAEEVEPAVTNIYTPDYSTAVNGQLLDEKWGVYTNAGLWGENANEENPLTLLPEVGTSDGAGLALIYSAEENSMQVNFKRYSSQRPYVGLYRKLDESYNAISVSYTHIAGDASKMNRILMPGYFNESVAAGKDRFSGFPLEAIVDNDVLTVKWDGTEIYSEDIDWRHNGEKVQTIAYSNPVAGGYEVGFALYVSGQYKCGATKLMTSFGGFNAIRFGFYNGKNTNVTMKNISVDAMELDSFGLYNLDKPVENVGYLPDVQYADPLHTVASDATTGYAFVSWKVDESVLYAPDFKDQTDGTLAPGWALACGDLSWDKNTWYTMDIYPSSSGMPTGQLALDYIEDGVSIYCGRYTNRKYVAGMYYQLDKTYDAVSVSYDHTASKSSHMGNLLMPVYFNAESGTFTKLPLSITVASGGLHVEWDGVKLAAGVAFIPVSNEPHNIKIVAFATDAEIGFALYIDGVYKYGGTKANTDGIPGFNAARMTFSSGSNCSFKMQNVVVRSMDVDSFGVYNLDAPAENYGYVTDKLYADPLHTVASDATTGYVFATWKEDSSFLKRFDFSADTDGALPAGWALSLSETAFDYETYSMPLYASDADCEAAMTELGLSAQKGLVLSYDGSSMYMSYKQNTQGQNTGLYYQFGETYESMTLSYTYTANSAGKMQQFMMPVYYDATENKFTKIPLALFANGATEVSWNGEVVTTLAANTFANGADVKIYAYSKDAEGGKEIGYKLYIGGEFKCEGSTVVESFPGFNAIRVQYRGNRNCVATIDNIVTYTDVARVGNTFYATAAAAAKAAQAGDTLELLADSNDVINVAADMTIDMNGHNLDGAIIADGVTLTGIDSANNDYSGYGIIGSVSGNVASTATADGRSYIAIADKGGVSFHRYYLKTTATVLHVEDAAPSLYYKYALAGDEAVLGAIDSCGIAYWIGETEESVMAQTSLPEGAYSAGTAAEAVAGELYTGEGTLISFTTEDVEKVISGRAYIKVGDTVIFSDNCLADTAGGSLETADSLWETLLVKQQNALRKLFEAFADVLGLFNINNFNPDTAQVLASFQEDLAQEQANLAVQTNGWANTENAAANGDFSNGITGWTAYKASVAEAVVENGNGVLALSRVTREDGTTSENNPFVSQSADLVPGSRCDISFRYKIVSVAEGGSVSPIMTVRWTVNGTEAVEDIVPGSKAANGEWGTVSGYVFLPENAQNTSIRVRARTTNDCQVYFDDVVVQTQRVDLDTEDVFFYTDRRGENANFTATIFGADYANVTFRVFDGTEVIWSSDAIAVADSKASVSFALSNLTKTGTPYTVVATAANASGEVAYVSTQNIYMYHRPTHLSADGTFQKDGETFYPVIGFGVGNNDIKSETIGLKNAISVARIGSYTSADSAVNALDILEKQGMMGMICMHPGMYTAGSAKNMEQTLAVMGDPRVYNHPALFGYCVEDEAFVNYQAGDPLYDYENAYRLIRKLDGKHVIMATENYQEHYVHTSKYLDAVIADIYCDAADQFVYNKVSLANQVTEKPIYALTRTCILKSYSEMPTIDDMRNNNYQALLGGATGLGYYRLRDAKGTSGHIWLEETGDPALWSAMQAFYMNENELLMKHFNSVSYETIQENLVKEDSYWHYSFEADGKTYVILLGMMEDASASVAAQVSGGWTNCTVSVVAGTDSEPAIADGVLSINVSGVEAILCQITPNA